MKSAETSSSTNAALPVTESEQAKNDLINAWKEALEAAKKENASK